MKKIKYLILLILPAVLSHGAAFGQEVMTLEKCREMALENNRSISIAERNVEASDYTVKSYRANYFPKISANGNYMYSNGEVARTISGSYLPTFVPDPMTGELVPNLMGVAPDGTPIFNQYAYFPDINLSLKLDNIWMAGVTAKQPLYTGGKVTAGYKMSRIGADMARLNTELTRAEVIAATDEAYWLYVRTTEMLKVAVSYQNVVAELLRNVQDAEQTGLRHRNDVLKVQAKANEGELQVLQADNGVRLARKNLCHILGLPLDSGVRLPETFEEDLSLSLDYTGDYSNRPELAMLEKQVELREQEVKLTRSDFLPQAGVSVNYGYINGIKFNSSTLFDKASFSVVASVSIPLFQGGEGHNKIRAARTASSIARMEREDWAEKMELELERAYDKCRESSLEVALTARSLEQALESMKVSCDRYQAGMETLADYMEAQTVWQQAYSEYINAWTGQRLNHTYYLKAAGEL